MASAESGSPGTPGRPGTSVAGGGEPEQSCEGDEYVITVSFEAGGGEAVDYEGAEAEILVQRLESGESTTGLSLEGDLTDVRDLASILISGGNCVKVVVVQLEDESGAENVPAEGEEAAGPNAVPAPVSP